MSERFSIKGKGAELFYGTENRDDSVQPVEAAPIEKRASQHADIPAATPAGEPASTQASKPASTQDQHIAPADQAVDASQRRRLRERIVREHPVHNSYRFTQAELDELRDLAYELETRRGIKITKNDLVRLGLLWLLDDYRAKGEQSLVADVFKERSG